MTTPNQVTPDQVVLVDPDKIEIHPEVPNIRQKITKAEIKDLMNSIREHGVQNPIVLFREGERLFLVSGERRTFSAQELKKEDSKKFGEIPAFIRTYPAMLDALWANATENIQREDLNACDVADRIKMLMEQGIGKEEIRKKFGKSISWINNVLDVLSSNPELVKEVRDGNLSISEATKITKIHPTAQGIIAKGISDAKKEGDKKTVRELKDAVDRQTRVRSSVAPQKKEIKKHKNMVGEIVREMKKDPDMKDSPQLLGFEGMHYGLQWALGEKEEMKLKKLTSRYKLEFRSDGTRLTEEDKKKAAKKKAREEKGKISKKAKKAKKSKKSKKTKKAKKAKKTSKK